jgi:rRNA small subunit pseudouridine methyltransferase Nep1
LILDQSYHHAAIQRLGRQGLGRGRPDIAHFSLLMALGSPLNLDGELRTIIHTRDNKIIRVSPGTRLPRNTDRFVSLLEQLYAEKVIPEVGPPLLSLETGTLPSIAKQLKGDVVAALTTQGVNTTMEEVANRLSNHKKPVLLIGAFPQGHFSRETLQIANEAYRIDRRKLEAWTVVGRAVYDFERAIAAKTSIKETTLM